MATETLSYSQLGDRLSWPEAARTLVRRLRLPRQKVNERSDASLKARIEELEAQLAKAEASAASHRADFERERERCERLTLELIRAAVETMNAKEAAARLEGELAARRSRPWWKWLAGGANCLVKRMSRAKRGVKRARDSRRRKPSCSTIFTWCRRVGNSVRARDIRARPPPGLGQLHPGCARERSSGTKERRARP